MTPRLRRVAAVAVWAVPLALLALLIAVPAIELDLAAWFFDPARRVFPWRTAPLGEFVRKGLPLGLFALAGLVALLGGLAALRRRPLLGVGPRVALYLLAALALGPGLVVNLGFKDHWGRPRPSTLTEFHGPNHYVRPLVPSNQCDDNCSFPSGHAALGFWAIAFALLAPPRRRSLAVAAAVGFGALIGAMRIAQGAHFLSDVIASGLLVGLVCRITYYWLLERPGLRPGGGVPPPAPAPLPGAVSPPDKTSS